MISTVVGLTLNFIGAIFVAVSFKAGGVMGDVENDNGKRRPFVMPSFSQCRFRFGIILMIIGFIIQLLGELYPMLLDSG